MALYLQGSSNTVCSNTYKWALRCQVPTLLPNEITAAGFQIRKALPGFFLCIFSSLTWRNLFSASRIFCSWRYQPGCTGIFWPAGWYQPACHYFWKVKSSQRRIRVQALRWFSTSSLSLPALGTHLKSRKGRTQALLLYRIVYPFFTCGEYLKRRLFSESESKTLFRK